MALHDSTEHSRDVYCLCSCWPWSPQNVAYDALGEVEMLHTSARSAGFGASSSIVCLRDQVGFFPMPGSAASELLQALSS